MATEEEINFHRFNPTWLEPQPPIHASDVLLKRVQAYLSSFPGRETISPNIRMSSHIRHCREWLASREKLERLSDELRYRERLGKIANKIRDLMGMRSFPDYDDWGRDEHFLATHGRVDTHWQCEMILNPCPFPEPISFNQGGLNYTEGLRMPKTFHYVACAIFEHGLTKAEAFRRLTLARGTLRDEEKWKSAIRRNDRPGMAAKELYDNEFMEEGLEIGEWRWQLNENVLMARELGNMSFRGSLRLLGGRSRQERSMQERRELVRQRSGDESIKASSEIPRPKRVWWA